MLLTGISAGLGVLGGLTSSVIGGKKAAEAAKQQQQAINSQKSKNEAWYNRNYYQNYMDSKESQSAIKRVEDTLRRRNQEAQANAAITGGTNEAVMAQQENDQQLMSEVTSNLASKGDNVKRWVDSQNQANEQNIFNQEMQQLQKNEAGGSQLLANGGSLIGSALSSLEDYSLKKGK